MRTSIAGAVVLLAGAGATTAAALSTGNNLALGGSDTLYEVTIDVISACEAVYPNPGGIASKSISYAGGGSGTGLVLMQTGVQEIAPMSRAMRNTEYCSSSPDNAASMMVGLDGVAIVGNTTQTCSTTMPNNVGPSAASINILAGGTGAVTGTYTLSTAALVGPSLDALRVLYFGIDNSATTAATFSGPNFGCNTDLRKTLIKNWNNLFSTTCAGGAAHCPAGLSHAWRRPDVSGTTDAFIGVLLAANGAARALGTMDFVPAGASQRINPFCNTFDAADPAHPTSYLNQTATLADLVTTTPLSNGRVNDQQDLDPIRTPCDDNDSVCGLDNKLGVVLPIFLPDVAYPVAEVYPQTECSLSCALVPVITGGAMPIGFKCPNGTNPIAGRCFLPYIEAVAKDPRCKVVDPTTRCFGTPGGIDGRIWNQPFVVLSSEVPAGLRFAGATYQYAVDRSSRVLAGSFFRQHMLAKSTYNARPADANFTGTCTQDDDTGQIGCLVDSDDCSVGFAGREAARIYPGAGGNPPLDANKALAIDAVAPYPDANLTNLLQPTGTLYKIARRLYVATGPAGVNFSNLPGQANPPTTGEAMLAKCFSQDSLVGAAMTLNGYLPVPAAGGGVQCLDYPQTAAVATPPVNTRGAGNVALGGCAAAANVNACANVTVANGWRFGL